MAKEQLIDIEPQYEKVLKELLQKYLKGKLVWVYGSRVKWTASQVSDLDLVVFDANENQIFIINEKFSESSLPFTVGLMQWENLSNDFQENIKEKYVVVQKMNEWEELRITEVSSKIGDGLHGTPEYDNNGNYYFINGNNLRDGSIIIKSDTKRVSEQEFIRYKKPLSSSTILLSINGTVGNIALYQNEKCILGKSACYININEKADRKYMYYELCNKAFQSFILECANGTTIPNVPLKGIREYTFKLPSLPEQKAIAEVLSSLDDKINLLHRQNTTIEQIAETLFRQWFVEEVKEDQEKVLLGDVVKTTSGGTPSRKQMEFYKNGVYYWVKSKELNGGFITETEETITKEAVAKSSAKILPAKSVLIAMYGATVGEYGIISKEMTCNQAICCLIPNDKYPYTFLFMFVKHVKEELINMAVGSAQQNISQVVVKKMKLPKASDQIIDFHLKIEPLFDKLHFNQTQIRILEKMRDSLLPNLIGGELKIKDIKEKYL